MAGAVLSLLLVRPALAADVSNRPIVQAIASAPDACFDGESLAASIGTWLNKTGIDSRLSILVRRPAEGTLRFTVERDGKLLGERDMPVGTLPCPDLRAALSLAIAIAIDHTLLDSLGIEAPVTEPTEREKLPEPRAPREPAERPAAPPPAPVIQRSEGKLQPSEAATLGFSLDAEALFGVLPGPALGAVPRLSLLPVPWLSVRGSALGTTRAQAAVGGGTASAALVAGRLEACLQGPAGEVRGGLCLGGGYGSLAVEGAGLTPSYSPDVRWAAALVRAEARYPARSSLAAVVGVDGWVPVLRPELQVVDKAGNTVDAWRAPVVGFGVSLGADLAIW